MDPQITEHRQLTDSAYRELERALGVTPLTVIPLHCARRGAALTLVSGALAEPSAVVIRRDDLPRELMAHGRDAAAIWSRLQTQWLVMCELVSRGLVPLWSTGEDNHASRRVAAKLGLEEQYHSVFLVVR